MSNIKNIADLRLDEITEDFLQNECMEMGEKLGVDTNQGSVYRDAADGHILRAAKFFSDLNQVSDIISIHTCTGAVLDERLTERGMKRNPSADTAAVYYAEFVGAEPEVGDLMSCDDHFFVVERLNDRWAVRSEETGTEMNFLVPGLPLIPEIDVDYLISATLRELAIPATDMEDDDSARKRFLEKIAGPSENGNKTQVKAWCEEITGVGLARIIPLWAGENTVLGIIVATDGCVPSDEVIEEVQNYIDPGSNGFGEGVATIGQRFTAKAAEAVTVQIDVQIEKRASGSYSEIKDTLSKTLKEYFRELALNSEDKAIVRYTSIGAKIAQIDGVIDYEQLTLNGERENIICTIYQVPVLGEVTIVEGIL